MSGQVETFTLGIEEEFQIIDPLTHGLSQDADRILPLANQTLGNDVAYELLLSQIEITTPVCKTLDEAHQALKHLRGGLIAAAAQVGKHIGAAATHPFSLWKDQAVTPKERYQSLIDDYQRLIQEQVIFGCHVHVGLNDRERALEVMNRARLWLAPILALSANSPFWESTDTQYASFRTGLWWTSPLSGPPPYFTTRAEHDEFVQTLVDTRSIEDATRIYWDIRLSPRFETVEFRVMDVCLTIRETLMLAGLVRGLVRTCYQQALEGSPFPDARTELLRTANWRAARYGLEAHLTDVQTSSVISAREMIEKLLEFVRPALEAEGDWEKVARSVHDTLRLGNGAMRQREVFQRNGNLAEVVEFIVAETARDTTPHLSGV